MQILEPIELTPETEAMWKSLATMALQMRDLMVAERCYAALGDVAKARYLAKINKIGQKYTEETGCEASSYFMVEAKIAMLEKHYHKAEAILLDSNEVEEAMDM